MKNSPDYKLKKVYIVYRSHSKAAKDNANKIKSFFEENKIPCDLIAQKSTNKKNKLILKSIIIALGGDGTFLKAAQLVKDHNIPILGINAGSLGFLTPHAIERTDILLMKILQKKLFEKKSYFMNTKIYKDLETNVSNKSNNLNGENVLSKKIKYLKKNFQSINDIIIERGSLSHLISISIYINKTYIYSLKADGIIVSSSLGSTAYNLAAGGPILHPNLKSFVITPICSHSLTNRPIVISDTNEIHLKINDKKAFLTIDGISKSTLFPNQIIEIKKEKNYITCLLEKKNNEFTLLTEKLKFGLRD